MPLSLVTIGDLAFAFAPLSGSITFPSYTQSIGALAFDSNRFTEITLPDSIKSVGSHAFYWSETTH